MTTDNIFATIGQTQANIANIQDQFFTVEKIAMLPSFINIGGVELKTLLICMVFMILRTVNY
jgi:hypothetical protein